MRFAVVPALAALTGALVIGLAPANAAAAAPTKTTTELELTPSSVTYGQKMHYKATVRAVSGTATPTGSMIIWVWNGSFLDKLWSGTLPANGVVEGDFIPWVELIRANALYFPDNPATFGNSEGRADLTVRKADTATTVTAQPDTAAHGKPVTLTARITPVPETGEASNGTFTFTDGGRGLGSCKPDKAGQCGITTDKLPLGKRTVTATYGGTGYLNPSTGTTTVRVRQQSTTTLIAAPNPATDGSEVALTARVAGADPKIINPAGGQVTFLDGGNELGKGEVDKDGKVTISTSKLATGAHTLTARFDGSDTLEPSTSEKVTVQINSAGTPGQGNAGTGGTGNGSAGGQQGKNLATTGADIGWPLGIGAALLILGAVAVTLGRRRLRVRRIR